MSDVTRILDSVAQGNPRAAEELLPLVYGELRKLAAHQMTRETPGRTQAEQQAVEFVRQRASVTGAPDDALVDASRHRHSEANPGRLHQQGDGLQGVPHEQGSLGIAAGLLVQAFDGRHLAAFLGALEAIGQHDQAAVDPHQAAAEQMLEGLAPQLGQTVEVQRGGREEVEQAVIAGVGQTEAAAQAGHAGQMNPVMALR